MSSQTGGGCVGQKGALIKERQGEPGMVRSIGEK